VIIHKQRLIFHLRVKVPTLLLPVLDRTELRFTLKTGDRRTARRRASRLTGRLERAFIELAYQRTWILPALKRGEMDKTEIHKIVRAYVTQALDDFDTEQATGRRGNSNTVDDEIEGFDIALYHSRRTLSEKRHVEFMSPHVDLLLKEMGIKLDKASESYQVVCRELLKADIRTLEANESRHLGRFKGTDEATILRDLNVPEEDKPAAPAPTPIVPEKPDSKVTLGELVEEFTRMKVGHGGWGKTTVDNHRPKFAALIQFMGADTPLNRITVTKCRGYAQVLELLPPRFALTKPYEDISGLTPSKLKDKNPRTLDVATRRDYLVLYHSLFKFAVENEYTDKNPIVSGIIPPRKRKAREQRLKFDDPQDLLRIFNPDTYLKWSAGRPSRFYLPLLGLFTGCRIEEVASLYCEHVRMEDGLWFISINRDYDRLLKNDNAERAIPLHPTLVDVFRFPQYVEKVRAQHRAQGSAKSQQRVFPELTPVNHKYSHAPSKAFGLYLRKKAGITDKRKVFHSFRHNVADHLKNVAMVRREFIEELEGRAGKTETSDRYAEGYQAGVLYEECILKLNYKVDLSGLSAAAVASVQAPWL